MAEQTEDSSTDAPRPSLSPSSGDRPSGFFPLAAWWLVHLLEPIGYVAAAAIGLGLWILLGEYFAALSDVFTVALLAASAAALWWAAWVVGNYPFAETWRLGNTIYALAIGTTGWIAWVATERGLEPDARFTLTTGIVAIGAYVVQRLRGDLVTWILLIASLFATAIAAGVTLGGSAEETAAGFALGALAAGVVAYLLAGRTTRARYQPTTLTVLSITILALLTAFGLPTALGIAVAVAGLGAALAAYFATRPATQIGSISAAANAALAVLVGLVKLEAQLSIVLIVAGTAVLAALGWAAKKVFGSAPDIPPAATPDDGDRDRDVTAPLTRPDLDTPPPPTAGVTRPPTTELPEAATAGLTAQRTSAMAGAQKTNGLAIASLILGLTWIFWIGSFLAVVFGHIALGRNDDSSGRGMAIAGLVLGYIGLGVAALIVVVLLVDPGV